MKTVTEEIYQYTELVYRDEAGIEVARERQYDDRWYDTVEIREPNDDELFDYYQEDNV